MVSSVNRDIAVNGIEHLFLGYSWVSFEKFQQTDWFQGFAYDEISDKEIDNAEPDPNIHQEWQDLYENQNWNEFHARRIKALAQIIQNGQKIDPVIIDIGGLERSGIIDGHHRIRALQYLNFKVFPVCLQGLTSEIKKIMVKID